VYYFIFASLFLVQLFRVVHQIIQINVDYNPVHQIVQINVDDNPAKCRSINRPIASPLAIFYQIFVPDSGNVSYVYNIIKEQINQIGNLTANQVKEGRETIAVHYNTVGRKMNYAFVEKQCSGWSHLRCNNLKHHGKGFEMLTQTSLWHYCQINPMHTVTYIHPKGSFHPGKEQDKWRYDLTTGALNKHCIDPPNDRCNVCGLGFQAAWGPLFLGNMWTAKCSYVKNLISPFDVEKKYVAAFQAKPTAITAQFYRYRPFSIPEGRYQAEVFIGTHPSIESCGFSTWNASWSMMPIDKFPANIGGNSHDWKQILQNDGHRTEWFLLPGLLWRSYFIYNQTPPADSWIWSYFPDGNIWKALLQNFTVREAIEMMAQKELTQ